MCWNIYITVYRIIEFIYFVYWYILYLHSVSAILPSGQLSNVPWRRTGVKYTNNEAYFDVVEEVDAIIDRTGATVFAEIQGYVCLHCEYFSYTDINTSHVLIICNYFFKIDCCIKLSGMPDLTLSFMNPRLFDDVSFHPCVRFKRWEVCTKNLWCIYILSNFCE